MGEATTRVRSMELPVIRVVDDTPNVKDFRFDLSEHPEFTFIPGQFVTLATEVEGHGHVTRAYSVASAPTQRGSFDLCIKLFSDGILSRFMFDHAREGYRFTVKGPYGKFHWDEREGGKLALIAAGTGIAPFTSMVGYIRDKGLGTDVGLLFSNKTESEVIYREDLERLAAGELPGFRLGLTVTRGASEGWRGWRRRIDRAMIAEFFPDVRERLCYLCGAPEMVNDGVNHLRALGVPEERIRTEKYY